MFIFANPWGLLALFALPVIGAIHLFRRKYPPLRVAGLFLWRGAKQAPQAGRVRDRLPLSWSLLLELLAATCLAFILAQPRFSVGRRPHLVVVLDDSASMSATLPSGVSVRDRAIAEIVRRAAELGGQTLLTIIGTTNTHSFGGVPALYPSALNPSSLNPQLSTLNSSNLIAGPRVDWETAQAQLDHWQPTSPQGDPAGAWQLAAQIAGDQAHLLYITDGPVENAVDRPQRMRIIAVGEALANISFASARWEISATGQPGAILGHLRNHSETRVAATVTGTSEENRQFQQTIDIAAGQTRAFRAEVPAGLGEISLRLKAPGDRLVIDSRVTLVEPKLRPVRLAIGLSPDHPAAEPLQRALAAASGYAQVPPEQADLVISSSPPQTPKPRRWSLIIGGAKSPANNEDENSDKDAPSGPLIIDHQSPLTVGVTFEGVTTGGVESGDLRGTPLISRGGVPLLVRRAGGASRSFVLNIDFSSSNLARSPDWPILISNLLAMVRKSLPGLHRWNYRVGETIPLELPRDAWLGKTPLTLTGPVGTRNITRAPHVTITPMAGAGFYELRDANQQLARFAVNFHNRQESNLQTRRGLTQPPGDSHPPQGTPRDSLHTWIITAVILLVLGGLLGNWFLLSARNRPPERTLHA